MNMALFMLMGKYSPEAMKAILETGSDREAAAKTAVEAAGGKLLGFYGMFGQDYNVAIIAETPGNAEYIGAIAPALCQGRSPHSKRFRCIRRLRYRRHPK
jgi:uncharacterized protein with GYD domain